MKPFGEKIESIPQLADWLPRAGVKGAVMFAQDENDREKMHVVMVHGDDDFLAAAGVACMEFLNFINQRLIGPGIQPMSRSERRRAGRRH